MRSSRVVHLSLVLTLAFHAASVAQAIKYSVQEIPIYPTSYDQHGGAVNDNSVVVGSGVVGSDHQCFQWQNGVLTLLPKTLLGSVYAFDINNSNVIVGDDGGRPVCWKNGSEMFLGGSGPDPNTVRGSAVCINSDGDVGGWHQAAVGQPWLPVVYSATTGSFRVLNYGGNYAVNYGINDNEDLVGSMTIGDYHRAFVYHNDAATPLNTSGPEYIYSEGLAINNFGKIVGYENTALGNSVRAVLWEIGNPNPSVLAENAFAYAINDSGTVVGSFPSSPVYRAAIFADGQAIDLNTLIPQNTYPYLTRAVDINNKGQILCHGGPKYFLLTPSPAITVRDAKNDVIPNVEFNLIKVTNDPPAFTENTLGSFTTDSRGRLGLTVIAKDTFTVDISTGTRQLVVGDSLKIAKHVQSVPAMRHPGIVGTMYSVHLDNAHFAEDGQMHFDPLTGGGLEVVLNHTELRYNLLVSVEWDALKEYLQGLQSEFRNMSNYLYDVSDGQIRLDTVTVYDDKVNWYWADVQILANNRFGPNTVYGSVSNPQYPSIRMPRKWFASESQSRIQSFFLHPLSEAVSDNFTTMSHEFGHYYLDFWDEYDFLSPEGAMLPATVRCRPLPGGNYGFMDHNYLSGNWGDYASEMSSEYRYADEACQNTEQWVFRGGRSCWDFFESWAERTVDGIPVPIRKPDHSDTLEHKTVEGKDFIPGPNNDLNAPDYNVGSLIQFTEAVAPPPADIKTLRLEVENVPLGGVNVILRKSLPDAVIRDIDQGQTTDAGGIYVLGIDPLMDMVLTADRGNQANVVPARAKLSANPIRTWLYGVIGPGQMTGDSTTMTLREVYGEHPWIAEAEVLPTGWRCQLLTGGSLPETPTMDATTAGGKKYTALFTHTGSAYDAFLPDSLESSGAALIWATDDSGHTFYVDVSYDLVDIESSTHLHELLGPGGQAEARIDPANTGVQRVLWLSSAYPVPTIGLESDAVQGGDAHTLKIYPSSPLIGTTWLKISYADSDMMLGDSLIGDESLLRMHRWHDGLNTWEYIGGSVDTARNEVTAEISQLGTFALFTTKSPVGVEDEQEGELPYRFELSQNYPNPFNPVTTIEYSVPSRSDVTIEVFNVLGQKVRTLVNETKSAGSYRIEWEGSDDAGRPVSTGVYLYRFQAGDVVQTRKMLLIK